MGKLPAIKSISILVYAMIFILSIVVGAFIDFGNAGMDHFLLSFQSAPGTGLATIIVIVFAIYNTFAVQRLFNATSCSIPFTLIWLIGIPFLMLCYGFLKMQLGLLECADAIANAPEAQRIQQMMAGISICGHYGFLGLAFSLIETVICMGVLSFIYYKKNAPKLL